MALVIIGGFMLVEVAGGLISGSLALIADAGHMLTDAVAIGLALWAKRLAARPASSSHTFGLGRAQVLAAFVNGLGLFALIGFLLWESIERLVNPAEIGAPLMLGVAVIGLFANIGAFFVLHGGDTDDVNMRGAILHVIGDMLGSVAAIVSAIVIITTGWLYADPLVTILVCALIARGAWRLTRETAHVLLQGAPQAFDADEMRAVLLDAAPHAIDIHDFRLWMLTPSERELTMHVSVADASCAQATMITIKRVLAERYGIEHSTVQVDAGASGQVVPFCADAAIA